MTTPSSTADVGHADPTGAPTTGGCRFEPHTIRDWLTGATDSGAVADALGIGDDFDLSGFHKWSRINNLVAAAQHDGVFGVDHHAVTILHLAGDNGFVDRHRVALTTANGAVLCSDDLDTVELLTDWLAGVDAAVYLLAQTAQVTNVLLQQHAQLTQPDPSLHGQDLRPAVPPQRRTAQPFRPLALTATTTPPTAPLPNPTGPKPVRPHR